MASRSRYRPFPPPVVWLLRLAYDWVLTVSTNGVNVSKAEKIELGGLGPS